MANNHSSRSIITSSMIQSGFGAGDGEFVMQAGQTLLNIRLSRNPPNTIEADFPNQLEDAGMHDFGQCDTIIGWVETGLQDIADGALQGLSMMGGISAPEGIEIQKCGIVVKFAPQILFCYCIKADSKCFDQAVILPSFRAIQRVRS
jgi:hypothetical protein